MVILNLGEQFPTQHQKAVPEPTAKLSLKPAEKLKRGGMLPEIRIGGLL